MNKTRQTTQKQKQKIPGFTILELLVVLIIIAVLIALLKPARSRPRQLAVRLVCGTNLKGLYGAIDVYTKDNNDVYPIADNWCDLLLTHKKITNSSLSCRGSEATEDQSSYAMNLNCKPNSPNDIVLMFETKAGWNQHGGPELLTTENHKDKGCNILFNDGTVIFVRTEELETLKWKP